MAGEPVGLNMVLKLQERLSNAVLLPLSSIERWTLDSGFGGEELARHDKPRQRMLVSTREVRAHLVQSVLMQRKLVGRAE